MEYLWVTQASEHPVLAKPLGPAKLAGCHLQGVQIQTLCLGPVTNALVKLVVGLDHHPLLVQVATSDGAPLVASCIIKVTISAVTSHNVPMLIDCLRVWCCVLYGAVNRLCRLRKTFTDDVAGGSPGDMSCSDHVWSGSRLQRWEAFSTQS